MKLRVLNTLRGMIPHEVTSGTLLASRGSEVLSMELPGGRAESLGRLPVGPRERWLGRVRPAARLLRLGCSNVRRTASGALLAVADRALFRREGAGGAFVRVGGVGRGSRPLHRGLCITRGGRILVGEYFDNPERGPVHLFASDDDGRSFGVAYSFPAGAIRHIHGVQEDPYTGRIWIQAGDEGLEPGLYRSDAALSRVERAGGGEQLWRSVSLQFTPEAILWGTDSPDEPSRIVRWSRNGGRPESVQPVGGPVYYSARTESGLTIFATTVETGSPHASPIAEIWAGGPEGRFEKIAGMPKDRWHPVLFQHGVVFFPDGVLPGSLLIFSATALRPWEGMMVIAEIEA